MRNITLLVITLMTLTVRLTAQDGGRPPLDAFVVIDGSRALDAVRDKALAWLSDRVLGQLLRKGDHLSVWVAAEEAMPLYTGVFEGEASKTRVISLLRALSASGDHADFAGALLALSREQRTAGALPPYILLVAGTVGGLAALEATNVSLPRSVRLEEFPGWLALQVDPALDPQVREAAAAYLRRAPH